MKLYWINIRTLKVFEDSEGFIPEFFEVGFICEGTKQCIEKYVDWVEEKKMMHQTFNTTAKKDVIKFILDEQENKEEILSNR